MSNKLFSFLSVNALAHSVLTRSIAFALFLHVIFALLIIFPGFHQSGQSLVFIPTIDRDVPVVFSPFAGTLQSQLGTKKASGSHAKTAGPQPSSTQILKQAPPALVEKKGKKIPSATPVQKKIAVDPFAPQARSNTKKVIKPEKNKKPEPVPEKKKEQKKGPVQPVKTAPEKTVPVETVSEKIISEKKLEKPEQNKKISTSLTKSAVLSDVSAQLYENTVLEVGDVSGESGGPIVVGSAGYADYQRARAVRSAVERSWVAPRGAHAESRCVLAIEISRAGRVEKIETRTSSGSALYDSAARYAAMQAVYPREVWGVTIVIEFTAG